MDWQTVNLLSLDLEMEQPSGEIIQLGFTIFNKDSKEVLISKRLYVNTGKILSPFITQLTGITQEQHDAGTSLSDVYDELYYWHKLYQCFMNPITWGGGDSWELKKQLPSLPEEDWCFGRRWIDAKTLYITYRMANDLPIKGGLKKACNSMDIQFEGPAHDAERDAYNTASIYSKLSTLLKKSSI